MMHYKTALIEAGQWAWILIVGFFTSQATFHDDIHKMIITVWSMTLGTYVSYIVKKHLNDKTNTMTFWDYFLGKRDVYGNRYFVAENLITWLLAAIALGLILNWIF